MAETAVGLFGNPATADAVVDALRATGLASDGIRVVAQPSGMAVTSPTSTPTVDFAAHLAEDLRSMGATADEIEAYTTGVREGGVLVFATGTAAQADAAISAMNAYDPLEIEEYAGAAPMLPGIHVSAIGTHDIASKEDRARAKSGGARVFTW